MTDNAHVYTNNLYECTPCMYISRHFRTMHIYMNTAQVYAHRSIHNKLFYSILFYFYFILIVPYILVFFCPRS